MGKRETETEVYDPLQLFLKKPGAGGKIPIDASAFRRQLLATIVMGTLYSTAENSFSIISSWDTRSKDLQRLSPVGSSATFFVQ